MRKWLSQNISIKWLKALITIVALGIMVLRMCFPDLKIDAVTFGLIVLCVLPWMSELIESAKFPGGWEIKFRDVREAGEKVTSSSLPPVGATPQSELPSFVAVAQHDPNLALVGLRIEIEKRLREFARLNNLAEGRPLSYLLRELTHRRLLPNDTVGGLEELVIAGNQAAHGARVQNGVAEWAIEVGPRILASLDQRLER